MRNIITTTYFLLLLIPAYSQTYFLKNETFQLDEFINYTDQTMNLTINNTNLSGNFQELKNDVDDSKTELFIRENTHVFILLISNQNLIEGFKMIETDESLMKVISSAQKKKLEKKFKVIDEKVLEIELIRDYIFKSDKRTYEKKIKEAEDLKRFAEETNLQEYLGAYVIQVTRHNKIDYREYNIEGELYILETGVSVKIPEISSLADLRTYYSPEFGGEDGLFSCNIAKSSNGLFTLSMGENKERGTFTTKKYSSMVTTSFKVKQRIQ